VKRCRPKPHSLAKRQTSLERCRQRKPGRNAFTIRLSCRHVSRSHFFLRAATKGCNVSCCGWFTTQLGVTVSSERFKTDIAPMGSNSVKLQALRPVTYKLKSDATGTRQYGLIAEEVAKAYPELVIRDQNGRIDGVRYDELAPMLLNELQKQQATAAAQAAEIRDLKRQQARFATQSEVKDLKQQLQAALLKLHADGALVAKR
jgi:hypothetical protein